jgi:DNA repair protein RecN (Recombination protein N)
MLETADVQMKEALSQLRHLQEGIELDAGELSDLESQLLHWHDLSRKHRVSLEKLQEKSQDLEIELTSLRQAGSQLEQLNASLAASRTRWQSAAETLRMERLQASELLSGMVSALLAELGMAGGRFAVALEDNDDAMPQAHGMERCEFMVSANPGQPLRPLRKVASGGELARISLAIEVATLGLDPIPTMVFDEVDAGIGGAVAETVGRKLRTLGNRCQVLAVTHLAQVASLGHQHLRVAKHSEGDITESQVIALEADARVQEIARMMGGQVLTPQTLAHAEVMLNHGQS